MKKLNALLMCFLLILFVGCSKENDCDSSEIRLISESPNPYSVEVDGEYRGQVEGNGFADIKVDARGEYLVTLTQLSGYLLFPTIINENVFVGCDPVQLKFP